MAGFDTTKPAAAVLISATVLICPMIKEMAGDFNRGVWLTMRDVERSAPSRKSTFWLMVVEMEGPAPPGSDLLL